MAHLEPKPVLGPAFDRYRNPGSDTYDGVALLADFSGLSRAEVGWTAGRLRELMLDCTLRLSRETAVAIVAEEAKTRPWEREDAFEQQQRSGR